MRLKRFGVIYVLLALMVFWLQGCQVNFHTPASLSSQPSPSAEVSMAETDAATDAGSVHNTASVQWVYMTPPIPAPEVSRPLFGNRDQNKIEQLIKWAKEAKTIDGTGLTAPLHGRSVAMNFIFADGATEEIRPAWTCNTTKYTNGNQGSSCKSVKDTVWISDSDGNERVAASAPLFAMVSKMNNEWMPQVKPYEIPDRITAGESFQISGHGWMTEKVEVVVSKHQRVIWKKQAYTDHGDFQITANLPEKETPAGTYDMAINSVAYQDFPNVGRNYGLSIDVW